MVYKYKFRFKIYEKDSKLYSNNKQDGMEKATYIKQL